MNIYMVCVGVYLLKQPRNNDSQGAIASPCIHMLVPKHHSIIDGTRCLENWVTPGLGLEKYKLFLKYL